MKIHLECIGTKISELYLQTLVLLYCPGEKFGENCEDSTLEFFVELRDGMFFGHAALYMDGVVSSESVSESARVYPSQVDAAKCFSGELFIKLFGKRFGYIPPWGIMTGVDPAGYAAKLLKNGTSFENVKGIFCDSHMVSMEKAELACQLGLLCNSIASDSCGKQYSLYAGIPFCPSRCRYCSFVSYATDSLKALLPQYLDKLSLEVKMLADTANALNLKLKSVYIGGGTPSMPNDDLLRKFLHALRNCLPGDYEFDFEAGRPDTLTKQKLEILKEYGVDRICINTQTTNDEILRSVGRSHTYDDFLRAYHYAKELGFCINTDLIAGLPGESIQSFENSVDDISSLSPENITVHAFSLKKSSEYTVSGQRISPFDPVASQMLKYSCDKLVESGYHPYYMYRQKNTHGNFENVGYSISEEFICKYNIYMMESLHSIFAAGAGASTKLVRDSLVCEKKIYNPKYPYEYLRGFDDILKKEQQIIDFYNS